MNIRAHTPQPMLASWRHRPVRHIAGFTLVEMLIVLSISAILIGVAVPSFTQFIANNAIAAQISALSSSLRQARFEALKRSMRVSICPTLNPDSATPSCAGSADDSLGWATGWIVFTDQGARGEIDGNDVVISIQPGFSNSGGIIPDDPDFVFTFQPNGLTMGMASRMNIQSKLAPHDPSQMITLCISNQGTTRKVYRSASCI